jgi:hypothetical protein
VVQEGGTNRAVDGSVVAGESELSDWQPNWLAIH